MVAAEWRGATGGREECKAVPVGGEFEGDLRQQPTVADGDYATIGTERRGGSQHCGECLQVNAKRSFKSHAECAGGE